MDNDIKKITERIDNIEYSKTATGKEKLSVKVGQLYYSIWKLKNDGTETKAWEQAKEIGSANLIGQRWNLSYTEYKPEGKDYPYRTIVGIYSPDAQPNDNALLDRLKNLELRVAVLEGKNVPTESGYQKIAQEFNGTVVNEPVESGYKVPGDEGYVGSGPNGEILVSDIPF